MKFLPSILFFMLLFCRTIPAGALVYLPGISSGSSDRNMTANDVPGISPKPLVQEAVRVNGKPLKLEIYRLDTTLDILERSIKSRFPSGVLERGEDFLRAMFQDGKNRSERWLFVFSGNKRPLTAFKMDVPGDIPPPGKWPAELPPLPAGASPEMVMELPRLDAVYGSFNSSDASGVQQLASYSARMASAGWYHAGAEHSPAIRGRGEIYFKNHPSRQIMWIQFGTDGNGAFYLKKLKK